MALAKSGIIPDKFILLDVRDEITRNRIEDQLFNSEDEEKRMSLTEA